MLAPPRDAGAGPRRCLYLGEDRREVDLSKVEKAAQALLQPGEGERVAAFKGESIGLGDAAKNPLDGLILVTGSAVIVAWEKLGIVNKGMAERFSPRDISVEGLEWEPLPGVRGSMEAKGRGNDRPTLRLSTPKGPFSLYFKAKHSEEAMSARDLISRISGQR